MVYLDYMLRNRHFEVGLSYITCMLSGPFVVNKNKKGHIFFIKYAALKEKEL